MNDVLNLADWQREDGDSSEWSDDSSLAEPR